MKGIWKSKKLMTRRLLLVLEKKKNDVTTQLAASTSTGPRRLCFSICGFTGYYGAYVDTHFMFQHYRTT